MTKAFSDMRQFLNYLGEMGHLVSVEKEVETRYEIAAYIRKTSDQQGPGLLFENVKGHEMRVAGGLFATLRGAAHALQCGVGEILREGQRSLYNDGGNNQ